MDPWQNTANAYQQGLNNLQGINQQGFQAQAQGPASIYDRFINGYVQQKQLNMQQDQLDRQNRLADISQQRADEIAQRDRQVQVMNFMDRFNREGDATNVDALRSIAKRLGPDFEAVIPADSTKMVEGKTYGTDQGTVNLDGMDLPLTPQASPGYEKTIKPEGALLVQRKAEAQAKSDRAAASLMLKAKLGTDKLAIDRAYREWQRDPNNPRNKLALERAEESQAKTQKLIDEHDAGLVDSVVAKNYASASNSSAQAGLASTRSANSDMSDSEKEAAKDQRLATSEAGKNARVKPGKTKLGLGGTPMAPPTTQETPEQKARKEWDSLPPASQTPEKKAELKRKYGIK